MDTKKTEERERSAESKLVGFWEAFWFWVKLGLINFGGPAGQIAIMHRELVENKRWVSEGQYLRTLNFCMLLPGPEAQQVATYIGWRLHGTLGGIVAGSFFVIPSRLRAILVGVTAAVVGVVANLAVFFATRVLFPDGVSIAGVDVFALVVAIVSFVVLQRFKVPVYLIVPIGALVGMMWILLQG
jgi:chromate transporter